MSAERANNNCLSNLHVGAVYICTEDAFPNKRLHQLAEEFAKSHYSLGYSTRQLSDGIFVEHAATIVRLCVCVCDTVISERKKNK